MAGFFNLAHQGTNVYLPERQHCPEAVVVTIKWAAPASAAVLITVNAEMNNKRKEANFTALLSTGFFGNRRYAYFKETVSSKRGKEYSYLGGKICLNAVSQQWKS